jgi:hypothetical protein
MKKNNQKSQNTEITHVRPALTMEDAKKVIAALRDEDAVRHDVQKALA